MAAQESVDGRAGFYTRGDKARVWQLVLGSGVVTKVLPQPAAGDWGYVQMTGKGVLYLDTETLNRVAYDCMTSARDAVALWPDCNTRRHRTRG